MKKNITNSELLSIAVASRLTMQVSEILRWSRQPKTDVYLAIGFEAAVSFDGESWEATGADWLVTGCPTVDATQAAASVYRKLAELS
jgi:hypothetical protein